MKIKLTPFSKLDFQRFISWIVDEELLVTIAGFDLKYPLDNGQLSDYLDAPKSFPFNVIIGEDEVIGHAEIIQINESMRKLDKVLIADKNLRGKGIGEKLMHTLLGYSFNVMGANKVELNVYDWKLSGIRCYKKVGFIKNPGKENVTEFGDKHWEYFNMSIDRKTWSMKLKN